jgi:hypothetical protein
MTTGLVERGESLALLASGLAAASCGALPLSPLKPALSGGPKLGRCTPSAPACSMR